MKKILLLIVLFNLNVYPKVLWVDSVINFSSQASDKEFSANQIIGKPSVLNNFGSSLCSWMPDYSGKSMDWIQVKFNERIPIRQILINENLNSSAIVKIIVYDSLNFPHIIYSNNVPLKLQKNTILRIKPDEIIESDNLRIEVNLDFFGDNYQIDAIAISDELKDINININEVDNTSSEIKENLGTNINSQYSELAPIISPDGNKLYFTRDKNPKNLGPFKKQDVWYAIKNHDGYFDKAINIGSPINNDEDNFIFSISPDGNTAYLGGYYPGLSNNQGGPYISQFDGINWSIPSQIQIENYYNLSKRVSYNLSSNGKIMLLAIKMRDSYGSNDIYVSFRKDNGWWTKPKNLGKNINTPENEISPFLASDDKTLYFSTSGFPGYGKSDLFMSKRLDDSWENWSEPVNLGKEINSSEWDAYYSIDAAGDYAYFVSQVNSIGMNDIYRVRLPKEVKPESVVLVKGIVFNAKINKPIKANIYFESLPEGKEVGIATSNQVDGKFQVVLPGGKKYGIRAEADGFMSISEFINIEELKDYNEKEINLKLMPIESGTLFRINNIFFETGKWELLDDSFSELNRLADFLSKNTEFNIQISGHTDNVGTDKDNLILSQNRALAVKSYLISKSIEERRIKTKGYGESRALSTNATEEGKQLNRRVEFEILN